MDPILALAKKHGLRVVGDAAQAHGAHVQGTARSPSSPTSPASASTPGKNLGAYGDAGALVTDNEEWAAKARMFANHGRSKKYDHDFEGVNSRLDGIQAAILSVKLRAPRPLDREPARRTPTSYNEALTGLELVTPQEMNDVRAVYHLYVVRVPNGERDELLDFLKANGVDAGIHYPIALPYLNAYRYLNHSEADFPEALKASGRDSVAADVSRVDGRAERHRDARGPALFPGVLAESFSRTVLISHAARQYQLNTAAPRIVRSCW